VVSKLGEGVGEGRNRWPDPWRKHGPASQKHLARKRFQFPAFSSPLPCLVPQSEVCRRFKFSLSGRWPGDEAGASGSS
jgi:hypothetical protein